MIYKLENDYYLKGVSGKEFSKHFAVYRVWQNNFWFRKSFTQAMTSIESCDICYFIYQGDKRVGGILLEEAYMNCFYLEPPHNNHEEVLTYLRELLRTLSGPDKKIIVGGICDSELAIYKQLGFQTSISRTCMIRPTEKLEAAFNYDIRSLEVSDQNAIKSLILRAYEKVSFDHDYNEDSLDSDLSYYFDNYGSCEILKSASLGVYDANTLIGICLISSWEDWPNVFEIAVDPDFQALGLAKGMLSHALSQLEDHYPVLRLFVTEGNPARSLYDKLGFLPGDKTTQLILDKEVPC